VRERFVDNISEIEIEIAVPGGKVMSDIGDPFGDNI